MKRLLRIPILALVFATSLIKLDAQPVQVANVPQGSTNFTPVGDLVYFIAERNLYRTDATEAGTILLAENLLIRRFESFQSELYFLADGPRGTTELWKSDGSASGTAPLAAFPELVIMGQTNDYLFFAGYTDATGLELYRTDGTSEGTVLVKDIHPGSGNGVTGTFMIAWDRFPAAVLSNEIYFGAADGVHGEELWKSDGTPGGTEMVADVNPGTGDGLAFGLPVTFEGAVYFTGITAEHGREPWRTDGTAAGTLLLTETVAGPEGSDRIDFVPGLEENLYFASLLSPDDYEQYDLWNTEGSAASTARIETLCQACEFDSLFQVYNGDLYFFLKQSISHQFWGTDGTAAGTEKLYEDELDGGIPFFGEVNDHMIFYTTAQGYNLSLERSNGESVTRLWSFRAAQSGEHISMAQVGDMLYFSDHTIDGPGWPSDPDDEFQLMQTDGFTVQPLRDIFNTSYNHTRNVTNYQGKVLFTRGSFNDPQTLWIYDPEGDPGTSASFTVVNADTDEDIRTLTDGDVLTKPADLRINIRYNPVGTPGSVVFKHQGSVVRRENEAPFALRGDYSGDYLVWEGATPGTHTIEATPYSGPNGTGEPGTALTVTFTITEEEACMATGEIAYEKWDGIQGTSVSLIPVNAPPSHTSTLSLFQAPSNQGTNYGARVRGYVCVPVTGTYTFWIASNDHSELWLSTDDNPENKRRIAWLTRATDPQEWDKFATQQSTDIWLEAGQRYYIEALHKQGIGTDHLAVGWQMPDGTLERPMAGSRLSPFEGVETMIATTEMFVAETADPAAIGVYPNPAPPNGELRVSGFDAFQQPVTTEISIVNFHGEVVHRERVDCGGGCDEYRLQTRQLPEGLYMIRLHTGDHVRTQRLVVE